MIRIACKCPTCKTNAATRGVAFPLAAQVPSTLARTLKFADGYVGKRAHALVYDAHGVSAVSVAVRARLGLVAA